MKRVLPGGTAAITDVGMCGCFDSVIGVKKRNFDPKVFNQKTCEV